MWQTTKAIEEKTHNEEEKHKKNQSMDLLEYLDLLDEMMDEDWEEDRVDRPLIRNRKHLCQMYDDIEFKLEYGLGIQ
uniref:Uncharacterized protein n=1 Tax=Romanomermis culicivorax TaxID=13658 RepID=A0A915ICH1_ROMCU